MPIAGRAYLAGFRAWSRKPVFLGTFDAEYVTVRRWGLASRPHPLMCVSIGAGIYLQVVTKACSPTFLRHARMLHLRLCSILALLLRLSRTCTKTKLLVSATQGFSYGRSCRWTVSSWLVTDGLMRSGCGDSLEEICWGVSHYKMGRHGRFKKTAAFARIVWVPR